MLSRKNPWAVFKEYLILTIGITIYVLGWVIFLTPNNLIGNGVTGISSIIQYAVGIKMGYSYFVINAILLVTSFFVLGTSFGGKTIYAIVLASVGLNVLQEVIPMTIIDTLAIQNGKLMSTIMGGIMIGLGIGMSISQGGSYRRYRHHSVDRKQIQECFSGTYDSVHGRGDYPFITSGAFIYRIRSACPFCGEDYNRSLRSSACDHQRICH